MLSKVFGDSKGTHVWPQRTICEVHRELYDLCVVELHDRPDLLGKLIPRLEEAYLMGIKLVKAMIDRKLALPQWADQNVDEAANLRRERIRMEKLLEKAKR